MKYFRMSYEEVVFNRSYLNIMLLNRSIPSFKSSDKESEGKGSRGKNNSPNKAQKEYHKIDKEVHANDFFMDLM